ncbi:colipase-like [Centruroides sculpturatus]|uniref:colipase-like n=1 Tax=Centruroides sculpturatus TaxID=218467 RepID=UPI000C6D51DD|nr:colipase-like [Centruroides sculpturatus]
MTSWALVLCCLIGITVLRANDDDLYLEQRAIDIDGSVILYQNNLTLGQKCINSIECLSGCCLKKKHFGSKCAAKSLRKKRCSMGQVKGGKYRRFCPCVASEDSCVKTKAKRRFPICVN